MPKLSIKIYNLVFIDYKTMFFYISEPKNQKNICQEHLYFVLQLLLFHVKHFPKTKYKLII